MFKVKNKEKKFVFFEEIFLQTNPSMEVVLKILFFILSNMKINFFGFKLFFKTYTITKIISIIKWDKLIEKKEFIIIALDQEQKTHMVHVASFINFNSHIYSF